MTFYHEIYLILRKLIAGSIRLHFYPNVDQLTSKPVAPSLIHFRGVTVPGLESADSFTLSENRNLKRTDDVDEYAALTLEGVETAAAVARLAFGIQQTDQSGISR